MITRLPVQIQLKSLKTRGLIRESKWKNYTDYTNAKKGSIALQDHDNKVYFELIRITEWL